MEWVEDMFVVDKMCDGGALRAEGRHRQQASGIKWTAPGYVRWWENELRFNLTNSCGGFFLLKLISQATLWSQTTCYAMRKSFEFRLDTASHQIFKSGEWYDQNGGKSNLNTSYQPSSIIWTKEDKCWKSFVLVSVFPFLCLAQEAEDVI